MSFTNPLDTFSKMYEYVVNHRVLGKIFNSISPVNFEIVKRNDMENSGLETTDKEGKPLSIRDSAQEKVVYTIQITTQNAADIGRNIAIIQGKPRIYNGRCWEAIEADVLPTFLSACGERASMLRVEANDHKIKKYFVEQLFAYAEHPSLKANNNEVIITLQNGTLKFKDNQPELCEFDINDNALYQLPYPYDPTATCEKFDAFLDEVLPEKDAQDLLMEMIGYCFIPTQLLKLETAIMIYGPSGGGKSVTMEVILEIVGRERVSAFTMEELTLDANARAQIGDKLLNYTSEWGGRISTDIYKKLISGEDVMVKSLYKDVKILSGYSTKFMFNSNILPRIEDPGGAAKRRTTIIGFLHQIEKSKMDKQLSKKLIKELPGIFNRVVEGITRLLTNKAFTESQHAKEMEDRYKLESDGVYMFINDQRLVPSVKKPERQSDRISNDYTHVYTADLYIQYLEFCKKLDCSHTSRPNFINKLREYFHVQTGNQNKTIVFCMEDEGETMRAIKDKMGL